MPRCAGYKGDGSGCERIVPASASHCYSHDVTRAEERKRNASKAARAKNGEMGEVKKEIRDLILELHEGRISRADCAVLSTLYGVLLRAIAQEREQVVADDVMERLEVLEGGE